MARVEDEFGVKDWLICLVNVVDVHHVENHTNTSSCRRKAKDIKGYSPSSIEK